MDLHNTLHSQCNVDTTPFLKSFGSFGSILTGPFYIHQHVLTPYQLMVVQAHAMKAEHKATMNDQQGFCNVKSELAFLKYESKREYSPKSLQLESSEESFTKDELVSIPDKIVTPQLNHINLKPELEMMIRFLLANMGKDNQAVIEQTRNYYLQNPSLLEIYDKITMKYFSAKKCKEDIIRFILRKAFRKIRTSIMQQEKVSSKKASLILCKRYFQSDMQPTGEETEEELLESLMPYNKNSKNRTMNINFVLEIFSSESFYKTYQELLPELNTIIIQENKKKEEKLVAFLLECVQNKCLNKLGIMHRLPWTDVWIEDAKNMAIAIMPNKRLIYTSKKSKT